MKHCYTCILRLLAFLAIFSISLTVVQAQDTVTDNDGNEYTTVTIGDRVWMTENLRVTTFNNGDTIRVVRNDSIWAADVRDQMQPAYAFFRNDSSTIEPFGNLYSYYVITDERGIAPEGWRVPTEEDWKSLETAAGMPEGDLDRNGWAGAEQNIAGKLQATDEFAWDQSGGANFTNELGFNWVGGSIRYAFGGFEALASLERFSSIWSADEDPANTDNVWRRLARYDRSDIRRHPVPKATAMSIRLVKDAVTTDVEQEDVLPERFNLKQNYPNPFNPVTTINYTIAQAGQVRLAVYDMMGRQVSILVDGAKASGSYQVQFNAADLPSGVYIYRLTADNLSMTKRMTLLK